MQKNEGFCVYMQYWALQNWHPQAVTCLHVLRDGVEINLHEPLILCAKVPVTTGIPRQRN